MDQGNVRTFSSSLLVYIFTMTDRNADRNGDETDAQFLIVALSAKHQDRKPDYQLFFSFRSL